MGMGTTYGYARVSTHDQFPQLQLDALRAAGCNEILVETGSGAKRDRPLLVALLARLAPSDTLVSWKLDRVGRTARATLEILDSLRSRGIVYRSLTEGLDTSTPIGEQESLFRPWITLRDGRRIYAKDVGKAAFNIPRRY